ncbi:hypothetical protein C4D60_Mb04t28420 [Musa balbisiana]|uniref:Bifunctional inhibitor/plant lipid transfer protein/seed storage helical domain-containing protein n=1 Tax=Musa balbisiana TaxID=52838 RepID=A0A4S8KFV3_MUSBA|nr:hypothetical protein C4D60_Mb04t28420 [Musa balbisiana]
MAKSLMMMGFVMALVTVLPGLASAQSGCTAVILGLAPCLSYITGNSSTPSSSCCTQLARVVKSRPACLCSVLNGGASSLGITINQTRALAMPGACKVQTPPVSACSGSGRSQTCSCNAELVETKWASSCPRGFSRDDSGDPIDAVCPCQPQNGDTIAAVGSQQRHCRNTFYTISSNRRKRIEGYALNYWSNFGWEFLQAKQFSDDFSPLWSWMHLVDGQSVSLLHDLDCGHYCIIGL